MGNFYCNISLATDRRKYVVDFLNKKKTTAYVHAEDGFVCVFPKSEEVLFPLSEALSKEFKCTAFAVLNHDDSMFLYQLFNSGEFVDDYNSFPGHFSGVEEPRVGGNSHALCAAYGRESQVHAIEEVLRKSYTFELNRHDAIVAKIELPYCTVGGGFEYIEEDDAPDDLQVDELDLTHADGDADESEFWPKNNLFQQFQQQQLQVSPLSQVNPDNVIDFMDRALKKAQENANQYVNEILGTETIGSAGDGAVVITAVGKMDMLSVKIKPEAVRRDDVEALENLVLAAVNDVSQQTRDKMDAIKQKLVATQLGQMDL